MGNVGNQLEDARKRQGLSIRDASEATKIRTEYLSNFENENFDFDLPDVYKRGFVKMYARYLKLDTDKFMTDVDALMLGRSKSRGGREFFGRMDLPGAGAGSNAQDGNPFNSFNEGESGVGVPFKKGGFNSGGAAAENLPQGTDKTLYWKIALIFVGTFIVVGLLALLVQTIFSSSSPQTGDSPTATQTQVTEPSFVIVANGPTRVAVQELAEPKRILFYQEVQAGQRYPISRNGDVRVVADNIERIGVEVNGKLHKAPSTGQRRWAFDANGPRP